MKYNSQNTGNRKGLPQRRSIRLKGYDYSQAGAYFITICCQDRECRFGKIENDEMILNEYGTIAYNEWNKLPERFKNFELDVFQIMPNHIHGIIVLEETNVGAGFTPAQNDIDNTNTETGNVLNRHQWPMQINNVQPQQKGQPQGLPLQQITDDNQARVNHAPTINATVGDVVGAYKSLVANGCLEIYKQKWVEVNSIPTMGKLWQRNYYEHIIRNEQSYQTISEYIINNPAKWNDDKFYKQ